MSRASMRPKANSPRKRRSRAFAPSSMPRWTRRPIPARAEILAMPVNILMPALSPTMEKGNLSKWLKKEGDKVKAGDVIAEIETDKATMEYEAIDDGVLAKIVVPEGTQDVRANGMTAGLGEEGEDPKTAAAAAGKSAPSKPAAPASPSPQSAQASSERQQEARPAAPTAPASRASPPSAPPRGEGERRDGHRPNPAVAAPV